MLFRSVACSVSSYDKETEQATVLQVVSNPSWMTPYVATLFVLAFSAQRLRMPAADGLRYRRGEAG